MEKILNTPFVEVIDISDEIPQTIYGHWKDCWLWENQDIAQDIMDVFIPYIQNNNVKVLISSHKDLEVVSVEYIDWIQQILIPKCLEIGLYIEIIIGADDLMGEISLGLIYNDLQAELNGEKYLTPNVRTLNDAKALALKIVSEYKN